MPDGGGRLGLAQEALHRRRVGRRCRMEQLERDKAPKDVVLGLVDRSHPPVAQ